ncbi:uncharacterized protein EDB93DRAFT_627725 [Suillus bovinus]|uniref:uncharacterized protein n=1 Tax=Suillus bovinus TaxID=48563 RepID=UPI001B881630|nr:uncharacterized protein EDB93DRAFT_627725 [Suillus bovinus]KAG2141811.1 hypothetical protein EDB93DRAFT_627725 [Suillus bovinus]
MLISRALMRSMHSHLSSSFLLVYSPTLTDVIPPNVLTLHASVPLLSTVIYPSSCYNTRNTKCQTAFAPKVQFKFLCEPP